MVVPYKNIGPDEKLKDSFNFHHSSTRISIECAFGVLVHRWGCLRKPLPMNLSIPKITALVRCLCILHNFCINQRLIRSNASQQKSRRPERCDRVLSRDLSHILLSGGFDNGAMDVSNSNFNNSNNRLDALLDGGHHFDDVPSTRIRNNMLGVNLEDVNLPRDNMMKHLYIAGMRKRPAPKGSSSTNTYS